jgi:CheY-like chemotaxis protein
MIEADTALVLVADDNEGIRNTTAAILRAVGFSVTEVQDGEEALEELSQKQFDVVLLDVRMPKLDGITVVSDLRPAPPPPRIVMVSAYDFGAELRQLLGERVFKYLKKPVPPKELIGTVSAACDRILPP